MTLTTKPKPYIIPEYSLTGDLLSYLSCGLQYRYYNRAMLPPSTPVQLWFGEFIHGVMEEAYLEWRHNNKKQFPWDWKKDIHPIELEISKRLKSQGMYAPPRLYCPYDATQKKQGACPDTNHPHKLIASRRAEMSINTWGAHLFPIIAEAEVKLKGLRKMINPQRSRSEYFGITGRIDVLSSVNLQNAPSGNVILHHLNNNGQIQNAIQSLQTPEYEIIIDYKGMRRPSNKSATWDHHEWQIMTYAWLRSKQPNAKPIIAGILFYLNELAQSEKDLKELKDEIAKNETDIVPKGLDLKELNKWNVKTGAIPKLSVGFKEKRSIRIIPIDEQKINISLKKFDAVVDEIEACVRTEINHGQIVGTWPTNPVQRTCTACDFKTYCPNPAPRKYTPTVP